MQIIKFNNEGNSFIRTFEDSEISKHYNAFGLLFINESFEENLKEYREERNEHIADLFEDEKPTLSELKEAIEEFQDNYTYEVENSSYEQDGFPKRILAEQDEDFVSSLDKYIDEDGQPVDEDDFEEMEKYVEEWDGSNFRKTVIESDCNYCETENLTEQWADAFENKVLIGSTRGDRQNQTGWKNYYFDKESGVVILENVTLWQGQNNTFEIIEDKEDIDIVFVKYASDEIENLRPEIKKEYGSNLAIIEDHIFEQVGEYEINYSISDYNEIFDIDVCEELGSWRGNNCGGEYLKHPEKGIISYYWSAYQGDFCGYELSNLSLEEIEEKVK